LRAATKADCWILYFAKLAHALLALLLLFEELALAGHVAAIAFGIAWLPA
jgi:hypothetical protein